VTTCHVRKPPTLEAREGSGQPIRSRPVPTDTSICWLPTKPHTSLATTLTAQERRSWIRWRNLATGRSVEQNNVMTLVAT
jgi:hypothetical protein